MVTSHVRLCSLRFRVLRSTELGGPACLGATQPWGQGGGCRNGEKGVDLSATDEARLPRRDPGCGG